MREDSPQRQASIPGNDDISAANDNVSALDDMHCHNGASPGEQLSSGIDFF